MIRKIAFCAIILGIPRTLLSKDADELRVQLAAKEAELQEIGEKIKKYEDIYLHSRNRVITLRESYIEDRTDSSHQKKFKKTKEELRTQVLEDFGKFFEAYRSNTSSKLCMLSKEFLGDFLEHVILKFYLIKMGDDYIVLADLIAEWEKCHREKMALYNQLSTRG